MNEGHAALLTIGLLEERLNGAPLANATEADAEAVRRTCVFTTHTPVPAGHDQFGTDQMYSVLGHERSACTSSASARCTTAADPALRFSRYVNGVAMQHGKVSQGMFRVLRSLHHQRRPRATWLSYGSLHKLLDEKRFPSGGTTHQYFRWVYGHERT